MEKKKLVSLKYLELNVFIDDTTEKERRRDNLLLKMILCIN